MGTYRALRPDELANLKNGKGISSKNPNGTWTLEEHIVGGSSKASYKHDPYISTTTDINIAKSFDSGNGVVFINLHKIPVEQISVSYKLMPVRTPQYHYAVWQQEISIKGSIPQDAIEWVVKPTN